MLRSLVVTTATGRGFPVVDFICLNEQATTIQTVLEYFKENNPRWKDVATIVIDKDFVEWQILEKCFPNAKILLCQFHAISYWKKVVKRPVYKLNMTQREEILQMTTKLLYRVTKDVYKSGYKELKRYCTTNGRTAFFAYFEKNWNSCRAMWANFARGKHFTAGNTTTNRIESNWNQLKMLLGMKTRIDKTIAGLLQHQMTITQQIVSELEKQHSSSRLPRTIPRFLRAAASRLSNNVLEKVKMEWEHFVNQTDLMSCEQSLTAWVWKVHCSHQTFRCHDLDWTCTCLFFTSNHLPCRHLMCVATKGRGLDKMPASTTHNRWSTLAALDIKDELVAAADSLQKVVRMSKLRLPKRLPEGNDEREASASTQGGKYIVYVRLRRNERANKIVLSSAEKYCYAKATLEPLLEHLSSLSSANFYQELSAWKETVEIGLRRCGEAARGDEMTTDGRTDDESAVVNEFGLFSMLDPADAIGTAKLMDEMEMATTDGATEASSDSDVPPTQLASVPEVAPNATAATKPEEQQPLQQERAMATACQTEAATTKHSSGDIQDEGTPGNKPPAEPERQVDVINMPKPKRRSNYRATTKHLRQTRLVPDRLALHTYPSGLSLMLNELVAWARNTSDMKFVLEMMDKYPVQLEDAYLRARTIVCGWEANRPAEYMHKFVIPVDLTRSMHAAITTAKQEQREPDELDESVKKHGFALDMVASIDRQFVGALMGFHALKTKGRMWFEDRKWLQQNWRRVSSGVDIFSKETKTDGITVDAVQDRHQILANEAISMFASCRMRTEFATLSGRGMITFENIVGGLCRGWLNDSHIDFCLETIADSIGSSFVFSSLLWACGWPSLPKTPLQDAKFVVHPVNLASNHWGVIIVRVTASGTTKKVLRVHPCMYEPLIDDNYHEEMETVWNGVSKNDNDVSSQVKEGLRGFIERWHQVSMPTMSLRFDPLEWLGAPQQPDAVSCGVLVVAQVYNYLTGNMDQQNYNVSKTDVKVMRLRML